MNTKINHVRIMTTIYGAIHYLITPHPEQKLLKTKIMTL